MKLLPRAPPHPHRKKGILTNRHYEVTSKYFALQFLRFCPILLNILDNFPKTILLRVAAGFPGLLPRGKHVINICALGQHISISITIYKVLC